MDRQGAARGVGRVAANARHRNEALAEVRIRNLRGIWDLRFPFDYPVTVLAGPNGSGKSTVLCACAYQVAGRCPRDFVPGNLFPDFSSRQPAVSSDATQPTEIEFHYLHHGERLSMVWSACSMEPCSSRTSPRSPSPPWRTGLNAPFRTSPRSSGQREAEKNAIPELLVALKGLIDSWRRL